MTRNRCAPSRRLAHNYRDGLLEAIDVGPRREVVLHVRLDPVWNGGDALVRRVRISAIDSFDEIAAALGAGASPRLDGRAVDEVITLSAGGDGVAVELAHAG